MKEGTRPLKYLAAFLTVLMLVASFEVAHASERRLRVVASIFPLADFVRQVGGDRVEVTLLLPPGASPHTFEPSPKTVQEISKAAVFIRVGAGLEFWADRLIAAAARHINVVTASDGVELIRGGDHGHDHAVSNVDPHVWLDPIICVNIVRKIEAVFSAEDPGNAALYRKNAEAYIARLSALDREIAERVRLFRTREYITFHSAWNYFSRRYGLKVAGVIEESPGKEPTARHIGEILQAVKSMKTRVVFAEPQFSPKIAEAIAREAGAVVLMLDPEGGSRGKETYIEMMRYNLSQMERAMK